MDSLKRLDLSLNDLEGDIPRGLGNLYSLYHLFLYSNRLTGGLSNLLNCSLMRELELGYNKLNWSLTQRIGLLSNLEVLDLSCNFMTGVISVSTFQT